MELTREQVEERLSGAQQGHLFAADVVEALCTALIAEMDKPKVWDGAPEWATKAVINWSAKTHYSGVYKEYTRTLPKSRIDEIAEEAEDKYRRGAVGAGSLTDIIKSAILQARKE